MAPMKALRDRTMREWTLAALSKLGGEGERNEILAQIRRLGESAGLRINAVNPPLTQMKNDGLFLKSTEWGYWKLSRKGKEAANRVTQYKKAQPNPVVESRKTQSSNPKSKVLGVFHNKDVEEKAIRFILKKERGWKRTPSVVYPGFDLYQGTLSKPTKVCEVKARSGVANSATLTPYQTETAKEFGNKFWVYLVTNVSSPRNTTIEKFKNPAKEFGW